MSEIKEGEYIRTEKGIIGKFKCYFKSIVFIKDNIELDNYIIRPDEDDIKAHSKNIIDLIEVGDYVNGNLVLDIDVEDGMICLLMPFDEENQTNFNVVWNTKNFIKTIVTKEQFNSVMYKVGDIE